MQKVTYLNLTGYSIYETYIKGTTAPKLKGFKVIEIA